jgi:hypothetical protein
MSNLYREPSIDANYQVSVQAVSEEKIIMWNVNGRQTTEDGCQVMTKDHFAFGKKTQHNM